MPSSTSYNTKTKDPNSVKGTSTTCLAILGYKLLKILCIWSLFDGLSTISIIFPHQREMKEKIDSFNLCLKASSFLLNTSTIVLNENYHKTPELGHSIVDPTFLMILSHSIGETRFSFISWKIWVLENTWSHHLLLFIFKGENK